MIRQLVIASRTNSAAIIGDVSAKPGVVIPRMIVWITLMKKIVNLVHQVGHVAETVHNFKLFESS